MSTTNNVPADGLYLGRTAVQPEPISRFSHEPFESRQFQFDRTVALVFDDMAARSIPGYFTTQQLCINLCKGFASNGTRIYDIGSATGTTIAMLLSQLQHFSGEIFGIEPSEAMRKLCQGKLNKLDQQSSIQVSLEDVNIEDATLSNASAILCNYTLHFISSKSRQSIVEEFYQALIPGGFLILSEKTAGTSFEETNLLRSEYHRFKELNGYSKEEILDKEKALSGILTPLSIEENAQLLTKAGFRKVEIAFRAPPFVTLVAWK
jgi:tRNA (cmo5U34)-methyltransferase